MHFLKEDVVSTFCDENGHPVFDGLIVSFSCHGIGNNIVTSDYKLIDRTVIHRCISEQYPQIREIPRIFLFDACDGARKRVSICGGLPGHIELQSVNTCSQSVDVDIGLQNDSETKPSCIATSPRTDSEREKGGHGLLSDMTADNTKNGALDF